MFCRTFFDVPSCRTMGHQAGHGLDETVRRWNFHPPFLSQGHPSYAHNFCPGHGTVMMQLTASSRISQTYTWRMGYFRHIVSVKRRRAEVVDPRSSDAGRLGSLPSIAFRSVSTACVRASVWRTVLPEYRGCIHDEVHRGGGTGDLGEGNLRSNSLQRSSRG
jgi:hypothetical protein